MKILISIILNLFFTLNLFAAELKWEASGHFSYEKVMVISENKQVIYFSNKGVGKTDLGFNTSVECRGHLIYENNKEADGSFFMCEQIDMDGEKFFSQFFTTRAEKDMGVQSFKIISGSGRWSELVGQKCIGAWSQITPFKKGFQDATFIWNGKCEVPDKTLERIKSYKKSTNN